MNTLYWLTVLGELKNFLLTIVLISSIVTVISFMVYLANFDNFGTEEIRSLSKKYLSCCMSIIFASLLLSVFIPSKGELYMMYGLGNTIDYLKENPTAKQLPDKCIKAIDKWVDNLKEKESEKETEND
jgi:hypothetical protein